MRLLVVEDDEILLADLKAALEDEGFVVDVSADGNEGLYLAREYPVDAAIVDLGLPGKSGLELIGELRQYSSKVPILVLTARDRWQDKVEALDSGADDYLTKPYHMQELLARINALLRRSAGHASPKLTAGVLELDTAAKSLNVSGKPVELTSFEYKVLEYLMINAGKVISKSELSEHIYDDDHDRDSNTLEVFVGRLRRKLDPDGNFQPIVTQRGQGYLIRQDKES